MGSGKSVAILGERLVDLELVPPCLLAKAVEAARNILNVNIIFYFVNKIYDQFFLVFITLTNRV
jgi:hypothetical protein